MKDSIPAQAVRFTIIDGLNHTYGYDILVNDKMLVHQSCIPCLKGKEGFITRGDAEKVAQLVADKVRRGIIPPSVTMEELRSLGIAMH